MFKTVLKEGGIVILLIIAIALILGIVFYDYTPNSKTVPQKVESYAFPEDVKEELNESMESIEQNIVRTYYIDSQDLSLYETTKEYNKGKANPFAETPTETQQNTTTPNGGTSTTPGSSTTTNTTINTQTNNIEDATNTSEYLNNKTGKY